MTDRPCPYTTVPPHPSTYNREDENAVFRFRFSKLLRPLLHLQLETVSVVTDLLFMNSLKVVTEPGYCVKNTPVQPFHCPEKLVIVKVFKKDGNEDRPVEFVGMLDLGQRKLPLEAKIGNPFNVGVDPAEIVLHKDRIIGVVGSGNSNIQFVPWTAAIG